MAIAFVQGNQTSGTDFSNPYQCVVTLNSVAAGSLLVCILSCNKETLGWTVSDSNGTTEEALAPTRAGSTFVCMSMHYVKNAAAGTHTITWDMPANPSYTGIVLEYSGAHTTAPFDKVTAMATGFGTTASTANATPAETGELAIAVCGTEGGRTYSSWLNSMTERSDNDLAGVADVVLGSTSAVNGGATISSSGNWGAFMALFKEGSAAAASPKRSLLLGIG